MNSEPADAEASRAALTDALNEVIDDFMDQLKRLRAESASGTTCLTSLTNSTSLPWKVLWWGEGPGGHVSGRCGVRGRLCSPLMMAAMYLQLFPTSYLRNVLAAWSAPSPKDTETFVQICRAHVPQLSRAHTFLPKWTQSLLPFWGKRYLDGWNTIFSFGEESREEVGAWVPKVSAVTAPVLSPRTFSLGPWRAWLLAASSQFPIVPVGKKLIDQKLEEMEAQLKTGIQRRPRYLPVICISC